MTMLLAELRLHLPELQCLRVTFREGGLRAFYRGLGPGICGAFPSHAAYFTVCEEVKQLLHVELCEHSFGSGPQHTPTPKARPSRVPAGLRGRRAAHHLAP